MTLHQTLHHQGWTAQDIAEMLEDFTIMVAGGDPAEMAFEVVFERDWEDWSTDPEVQIALGNAATFAQGAQIGDEA